MTYTCLSDDDHSSRRWTVLAPAILPERVWCAMPVLATSQLNVSLNTVIRDIQRAIYLTDYVTSWICGHIKRKENWTKCSRACTTEICSLAEFLAVVSLSKILRGHAKYLDRDFFPNVEESMAQRQGGVSAREYQQCQLLLLQLGAEHEAMFSNL